MQLETSHERPSHQALSVSNSKPQKSLATAQPAFLKPTSSDGITCDTFARTQQMGPHGLAAQACPEPSPHGLRAKQPTYGQITQALTIPSDLGLYLGKADTYSLAAAFPKSAPYLLNHAFHRRHIARLLGVSDFWLKERIAKRSHLVPDDEPTTGAYLAKVHQAFNRIAVRSPKQKDNLEAINQVISFTLDFAVEIFSDILFSNSRTDMAHHAQARSIRSASTSAAAMAYNILAVISVCHMLLTWTLWPLGAPDKGVQDIHPPSSTILRSMRNISASDEGFLLFSISQLVRRGHAAFTATAWYQNILQANNPGIGALIPPVFGAVTTMSTAFETMSHTKGFRLIRMMIYGSDGVRAFLPTRHYGSTTLTHLRALKTSDERLAYDLNCIALTTLADALRSDCAPLLTGDARLAAKQKKRINLDFPDAWLVMFHEHLRLNLVADR